MFANAQITNPGSPTLLPPDGAVVKVIDNKGTVKYIQSNNGITSITSTASGNQTRTTFQLGGTLDTATYIDVNGKVFGLDNIPVTAVAAATATDATHTDGGGSGWTLLVRNEATGGIEKMLVSDMVQSGWAAYQLDDALALAPEFTIDGVSLASFQTVYVYRNGAKLVAGVDYTIGASDNKVTLTPAGTGNPSGLSASWTDEAFTLYAGDKIEIHFIK